ncbi:Voltage-dependent anion channel [Peptoclostridium litorale DSM 5388]|uniref:Putative C4-dicarboxylate transporter/malic acid transport protein n=1 Tax=Peptoclostridium litorale DSM 5388 TaxID=1121324 RepID=A0A069RI98_PEPLI|nr:hypothetical protein [Peptoclostridium litorale]KDR95870.1 putative C4-dicarboxylate transporter/malic acid transport protein [Peptoclostridium litorale DSM 5388]SIO10979.1 Voltage-dependent anion channel [Peptoclostridium litorale DSM 5388]
MKNIAAKLPIPASGLMLALAASGNLMMPYGAIYKNVFGVAFYLTLLPVVIYRVLYVKGIPEPVLPTNAIFAAPASLCLAGYMSSFQDKSIIMMGFLTVLSLVMTFSVILYLPKMLKLNFYPSYSAFTFPFVISAIAMKKTGAFLQSSGYALNSLKYIVVFEEILSIVIVLYVLVQYIKFLLPE